MLKFVDFFPYKKSVEKHEKKQKTLWEIFVYAGVPIIHSMGFFRQDPSIINDQKTWYVPIFMALLILADYLPDYLVSVCLKRFLIFPYLKIDGNYLT